MKIVCISKFNGTIEVDIKPDTAMLVNNKPLFIPNFTNDLRCVPCLLLRINRLGRNIASRFAYRYYDALTIGLDFRAYDRIQQARSQCNTLSPWLAFDGSLAIGQWIEKDNESEVLLPSVSIRQNEQSIWNSGIATWVYAIDDAIALASSYFKLAQGDIIAIAADTDFIPLKINDCIEIGNETDKLIRMNIK